MPNFGKTKNTTIKKKITNKQKQLNDQEKKKSCRYGHCKCFNNKHYFDVNVVGSGVFK